MTMVMAIINAFFMLLDPPFDRKFMTILNLKI